MRKAILTPITDSLSLHTSAMRRSSVPPAVSFLDGVDAGGARARLNEITGTLCSKRSFNIYTLFSFIQHNTTQHNHLPYPFLSFRRRIFAAERRSRKAEVRSRDAMVKSQSMLRCGTENNVSCQKSSRRHGVE